MDKVVTSGAAVDALLLLQAASSPEHQHRYQSGLQSLGARCRLDLLSWHADVVAWLPSAATALSLSEQPEYSKGTLCLCWRPPTHGVGSCGPTVSTLVAARSPRAAGEASVAPNSEINWDGVIVLDPKDSSPGSTTWTGLIRSEEIMFHGCIVAGTSSELGEALLPEGLNVQLAWLRAVHDLGDTDLSVGWRPRGLFIVRRSEPLHMLLQEQAVGTGLTGAAMCNNYEWRVAATRASNKLQVTMRCLRGRTAAASTRRHAEAEGRCRLFLESLDERLRGFERALEPRSVDDASRLAWYVFI